MNKQVAEHANRRLPEGLDLCQCGHRRDAHYARIATGYRDRPCRAIAPGRCGCEFFQPHWTDRMEQDA